MDLFEKKIRRKKNHKEKSKKLWAIVCDDSKIQEIHNMIELIIIG